MNNLALGMAGENLARILLESKGYQICLQNYKCPFGEIDIIAVKNRCVHFIEVKTRSTDEYGRPAEAINQKKLRNMKNSANYYLCRCGWNYDEVHFEAVEVMTMHITGIEL